MCASRPTPSQVYYMYLFCRARWPAFSCYLPETPLLSGTLQGSDETGRLQLIGTQDNSVPRYKLSNQWPETVCGLQHVSSAGKQAVINKEDPPTGFFKQFLCSRFCHIITHLQIHVTKILLTRSLDQGNVTAC